MINKRLLLLALAVAGGLAAVFSVGRRLRQTEKRLLDEGLRSWEEEGGNLEPPAARFVARPGVTP